MDANPLTQGAYILNSRILAGMAKRPPKPVNHHYQRVDQWVENALRKLERDDFLFAFDHAFDCIWQVATLTLGEVTMQAVSERAVYVAMGRFPWLSPLEEDGGGIYLSQVLRSIEDISDKELQQGLRFMLGELLTVLGNLSAEIITSKLHACLSDHPMNEPKLSNSARKQNRRDVRLAKKDGMK